MTSRVDPVRSQSSVKSSQPESIRSVLLPKGQWRHINYRVLPPRAIGETGNRYVLKNQLTISGQPVGVANTNRAVQRSEILKPHEYFFVILTSRPDRFNDFKLRTGFDSSLKVFVINNLIIISVSSRFLIKVIYCHCRIRCWTGRLRHRALGMIYLPVPSHRATESTGGLDSFGGLLIVNGAVASENLSSQLSLIFCRCN